MSVDYYTRLERGDLSGVSDSVLEAVARALQLDDAETAHLFDLARTANASPVARKPRKTTAEPCGPASSDPRRDHRAPAFIRNGTSTTVAANRLGEPSTPPCSPSPAPNIARFAFLNPARPGVLPGLGQDHPRPRRDPARRRGTQPLRQATHRPGRRAVDPPRRFRRRWAAHNVRSTAPASSGSTIPSSATSTSAYEAFELAADPGLKLSIYTAEPGTASADALKVLASWAATADNPAPQHATLPSDD